MAISAQEALQRATKLRAEAEERKVQETKDWKVVADSLEDTELEIEVRTGPTGRLYGSITPAIIADSLAEKLGQPKEQFLMTVAIGASCAFLSPIGHQCNTLVMAPGNYKFGDYWKVGLPLEILIVIISIPLIIIFWS